MKLKVVEVPSEAINIILDMGYLIFKRFDETKMVTDDEIEKDCENFLRTGRSKFEGMEVQSPYKLDAIKAMEANSIVGTCTNGTFDFIPTDKDVDALRAVVWSDKDFMKKKLVILKIQ